MGKQVSAQMKGMQSVTIALSIPLHNALLLIYIFTCRHYAESTLGDQESCTLASSTDCLLQKFDPDLKLEYKPADVAFADSSNDVTDTSIPCATPKTDALPQEDPLTDFKEGVPLDYSAKYIPLEGCIPQAFAEDFNSVLYSSCGDYQQWVVKTADVIQSNERLSMKVCINHLLHKCQCITSLNWS